MTFDLALADNLDSLAAAVFGEFNLQPTAVAELATAASARLRQFAAMPADALPPPPIVPVSLTPLPKGAFESILEERDQVGDFHDLGEMPAKNARLPKPKDEATASLRDFPIFEDPRLQPGYKPPSKR